MAALVRADRRTATKGAAGWLLAAAAAQFTLLAVTGILLVLFYRPSASQAWGVHQAHTPVTFAGVVRIAHRLASYLFGLTALALLTVTICLAVARSLRTRPHGLTVVAAVGAFVVGLGASFTGYLLPWDQLALRAVTVGTNMMGFRPVLSGAPVQFVLVGGSAVSLPTFRHWFYVHTMALPLLAVALGVAIFRRLGRRNEIGRAVTPAWDDGTHGPYLD